MASLERKPSGRPPRSPGLSSGPHPAGLSPFEAVQEPAAQTEIEAPAAAQPGPFSEPEGEIAEKGHPWMAQPIIAPQMVKAGHAERYTHSGIHLLLG